MFRKYALASALVLALSSSAFSSEAPGVTPAEIKLGGERILKQCGDDLSRDEWQRLTYVNHDRLHHLSHLRQLTHTHDAFCGQRIGKTKGGT